MHVLHMFRLMELLLSILGVLRPMGSLLPYLRLRSGPMSVLLATPMDIILPRPWISS